MLSAETSQRVSTSATPTSRSRATCNYKKMLSSRNSNKNSRSHPFLLNDPRTPPSSAHRLARVAAPQASVLHREMQLLAPGVSGRSSPPPQTTELIRTWSLTRCRRSNPRRSSPRRRSPRHSSPCRSSPRRRSPRRLNPRRLNPRRRSPRRRSPRRRNPRRRCRCRSQVAQSAIAT